jgi:hypothetical protein
MKKKTKTLSVIYEVKIIQKQDQLVNYTDSNKEKYVNSEWDL